MRIGILGPLTITETSGSPAWPEGRGELAPRLEPKQAVVLLVLAANADRGVPLQELVHAVYGSADTLLYKRSIESVVSRLRATLRAIDPAASDVLPAARGGFYIPSLPADAVDALRFLSVADPLLNQWAALAPDARRRQAGQAIAEWRDDPVRIHAGLCPATSVFRRFTSSLAELGLRYVHQLLDENDHDLARRELSRLTVLLPDNAALRQLAEEVADGGPQAGGTTVRTSTGTAVAELVSRVASTSSRRWDAVAVTAHNFDRIYLVDRVAPDHEVSIDVPFEVPGGSGANTIAALGRLGCAVAAAGIVAGDEEGQRLLDGLTTAGVDTANVLVDAHAAGVRTGHSVIFSDPQGVRSIYVHPGVNEVLAERMYGDPARVEVLKATIARCRILHLTSFTSPAELGLQEVLVSALDAYAVLSLNPGALYASLGLDRLDPILSRANVLFLYEQNLRELVDNSAAPSRGSREPGVRNDLERLYAWKGLKGYDQPLVTLVKRFRSALSGQPEAGYLTIASGRCGLEEVIGTQARIGPTKRRSVRDSTGAGDAMAAGLHFGLLHGASLAECADLAYLMATLVSDHIGGRDGQPTATRLHAAWTTHFPGVAPPAALASAAVRSAAPASVFVDE